MIELQDYHCHLKLLIFDIRLWHTFHIHVGLHVDIVCRGHTGWKSPVQNILTCILIILNSLNSIFLIPLTHFLFHSVYIQLKSWLITSHSIILRPNYYYFITYFNNSSRNTISSRNCDAQVRALGDFICTKTVLF